MSAHNNNYGITRRDFIKTGAAGGAGLAFMRANSLFAEETSADIWVIEGSDNPAKLMEACMKTIGENGGFGKGVNSLALKINAAWARTPEQGANTHPVLVDGFLKGCSDMGIKKVTVPENPCHSAKETFPMSGIQDVVKNNGFDMIDMRANAKRFKKVELPGAKNLKEAKVTSDFLETEAIVNMPVAKHHGMAALTMAMKNWMGAVEDRGFFHRNDLHQCIADICTLIKPTWNIVDATRILLDSGPQGPTKNMKYPNILVLGKDQVAVDVYTSSLFFDDPFKVRYLEIAKEMNLGVTDRALMRIHKVQAA